MPYGLGPGGSSSPKYLLKQIQIEYMQQSNTSMNHKINVCIKIALNGMQI